jgi:hypothetical protein
LARKKKQPDRRRVGPLLEPTQQEEHGEPRELEAAFCHLGTGLGDIFSPRHCRIWLRSWFDQCNRDLPHHSRHPTLARLFVFPCAGRKRRRHRRERYLAPSERFPRAAQATTVERRSEFHHPAAENHDLPPRPRPAVGVPRVCTAAFSDAKQLIIARGVDPDLMTSKLDTSNQLKSSVTTGDAECCAAVTKIDGVKLQQRDLLRVLSRAARVAIKHEWAKEAEKAQRLSSGQTMLDHEEKLRSKSAVLFVHLLPPIHSTTQSMKSIAGIPRPTLTLTTKQRTKRWLTTNTDLSNGSTGTQRSHSPPVKAMPLAPYHLAATVLSLSHQQYLPSVPPRHRMDATTSTSR